MILRLAIEQARSQRRYIAWTAAFIAFAIGLVTFALASVEAEFERARVENLAYGITGEHTTWAFTYSGAIPEDWFLGPNGKPVESHTLSEVNTAISQALDDGVSLVAIRNGYGTLESPASAGDPGSSQPNGVGGVQLEAIIGDYPWDFMLASGHAPGAGEAVLSWDIADYLGLAIGDKVVLVDSSTSDIELTVSGVLRVTPPDLWGNPGNPQGRVVVAWELSNENSRYFVQVTDSAPGTDELGYYGPFTQISYFGSHPALDALASDYGDWDGSWGSSFTWPPAATYVFASAGVLVLSSLIGAAAVGRSQGEARARWVATARTLGTPQRSLRIASLVESALVGIITIAPGFALGYGAAQLRLAEFRSGSPAPLAISWIPVPWWIIGGVVAVGLLLTLWMSALPAFWAARIPPVAAHKAVGELPPVLESRNVPVRWLVLVFFAGISAIVVGSTGTFGGTIAMTFGAILAAPLGVALLLELLRRAVPAAARRLGRFRSAWTVVAGDTIAARPRQAIALAMLSSLAVGVSVFGIAEGALVKMDQYLSWRAQSPGSTWWREVGGPFGGAGDSTALWVALLLVIPTQAIALAITLSSRRAAAGESATRQAMGLTPDTGRAAAGAQHALPQLVGVAMGILGGLAVTLFLHFGTNFDGNGHRGTWNANDILAGEYALCSSLLYVGLFVGLTLAGSYIVARTGRVRTPVEAIARDF